MGVLSFSEGYFDILGGRVAGILGFYFLFSKLPSPCKDILKPLSLYNIYYIISPLSWGTQNILIFYIDYFVTLMVTEKRNYKKHLCLVHFGIVFVHFCTYELCYYLSFMKNKKLGALQWALYYMFMSSTLWSYLVHVLSPSSKNNFFWGDGTF